MCVGVCMCVCVCGVYDSFLLLAFLSVFHIVFVLLIIFIKVVFKLGMEKIQAIIEKNFTNYI